MTNWIKISDKHPPEYATCAVYRDRGNGTYDIGAYRIADFFENEPRWVEDADRYPAQESDEYIVLREVERDMNCDSCGKDLTYIPEDPLVYSPCVSPIAVYFSIPRSTTDKHYNDFISRLVHPYKPGQEYRICFPCILSAFGLMPKEGGTGGEVVYSKKEGK